MQEDLVDTLRRAADAVDKAELPLDLRPVGFWALLQPPAREAAPSPRAETASNDASVSSGAPLTGLADRLGLELSAVETVFYADDSGRPTLGLAAGRLGRRTAEATRRIALLVSVARQFDGREQFTASSAIRTVCQDFNVFDTGNFAKTLLAMTDVFQFQGSGSSRRVRLTRPGYDEVRRLVQELGS